MICNSICAHKIVSCNHKVSSMFLMYNSSSFTQTDLMALPWTLTMTTTMMILLMMMMVVVVLQIIALSVPPAVLESHWYSMIGHLSLVLINVTLQHVGGMMMVVVRERWRRRRSLFAELPMMTCSDCGTVVLICGDWNNL